MKKIKSNLTQSNSIENDTNSFQMFAYTVYKYDWLYGNNNQLSGFIFSHSKVQPNFLFNSETVLFVPLFNAIYNI